MIRGFAPKRSSERRLTPRVAHPSAVPVTQLPYRQKQLGNESGLPASPAETFPQKGDSLHLWHTGFFLLDRRFNAVPKTVFRLLDRE